LISGPGSRGAGISGIGDLGEISGSGLCGFCSFSFGIDSIHCALSKINRRSVELFLRAEANKIRTNVSVHRAPTYTYSFLKHC